jgi:SAM-dependent methyltransferase
MSAQDRTLDRYQELMQINAAGHVLRSAREVGLFDELRKGQRTVEQLIESLSLTSETTGLLLDCLVSMNVIERYADDYALSPVMRLLCEHDTDLGDAGWLSLTGKLQQSDVARSDRAYLDAIAATQWIHTPASMQAAEILDVGSPDPESSEETRVPINILDLGCGSAVWSCALAYRDPTACVVAVDHRDALAAAEHTARSIDLGERFSTMVGDPESISLPTATFDLVLIAQRLHSVSLEAADRLLRQSIGALAPGGRLVIIDLFRGPTKPRLSETIEAMRLHLSTNNGRMRTIKDSQAQLESYGLGSIQFTFIAASRINLGLMVAIKP